MRNIPSYVEDTDEITLKTSVQGKSTKNRKFSSIKGEVDFPLESQFKEKD